MRHVSGLIIVGLCLLSGVAGAQEAPKDACPFTTEEQSHPEKLPSCSYSALNGNCRVTINRFNPVTPPTIYVKPACKVTVLVRQDNGYKLEHLTLDWKQGSIVLPADIFSTVFTAISPSLGKLTVMHAAGNETARECENALYFCTDPAEVSRAQERLLGQIASADPVPKLKDTITGINTALLGFDTRMVDQCRGHGRNARRRDDRSALLTGLVRRLDSHIVRKARSSKREGLRLCRTRNLAIPKRFYICQRYAAQKRARFGMFYWKCLERRSFIYSTVIVPPQAQFSSRANRSVCFDTRGACEISEQGQPPSEGRQASFFRSLPLSNCSQDYALHKVLPAGKARGASNQLLPYDREETIERAARAVKTPP
jgi:hypothetical protein